MGANIAPLTLDFGARQRYVFNFTPAPLYSAGILRYPSTTRAGQDVLKEKKRVAPDRILRFGIVTICIHPES